MVIGFILVTTSPSMEKVAVKALSKVPEVQEAHLLFGEYDILLKVEAKDMDDLGRIVIKKIRAKKGVIDTETLSGMDYY
jgi:DNA-binding Lrp family transcriptional regulator